MKERRNIQSDILVSGSEANYFLNFGSFSDLNSLDALLTDESKTSIKTLAEFESFLFERQPSEETYGIFSKDVTMCRFFGSKNSENILAEIEKKNTEQGMGNIEIPNTSIRLINYSICPTCSKIFSYKDLGDYYRCPKTDTRFQNSREQARNDTRVFCSDCNTWFLPALIIADSTPKNEVQFLCRNQTMEAVEIYFNNKGKHVLTKKKSNIKIDYSTGLKSIKNDILLMEMEQKPALITNMLQYTPANLTLNLIDGTNIEKGDVLFGYWGKGLV